MFDWFSRLARTDTALDVAHVVMLMAVLLEQWRLRVLLERVEARAARLQTAAYKVEWKLDRVLRNAATEPSLRRPGHKVTEQFSDVEVEAVLRAAAEVKSDPPGASAAGPDDPPTTRRAGPAR